MAICCIRTSQDPWRLFVTAKTILASGQMTAHYHCTPRDSWARTLKLMDYNAVAKLGDTIMDTASQCKLVHGCTVHRTRRDAAVSRCTSQVTTKQCCIYTTLVNIPPPPPPPKKRPPPPPPQKKASLTFKITSNWLEKQPTFSKSKEWTTVWNCPASLKNERLCETVRQVWRMNDCVKLSGKSEEWTTVWNCPASLKNERLCETVRQVWRMNDCVKLSGKSKEWMTVWNCPASLKNERLCETVRQV